MDLREHDGVLALHAFGFGAAYTIDLTDSLFADLQERRYGRRSGKKIALPKPAEMSAYQKRIRDLVLSGHLNEAEAYLLSEMKRTGIPLTIRARRLR
jgi:hypothetical protein